MKKLSLLLVFLASPAFAQNQPARNQASDARFAAGCGSNDTQFDVSSDKKQRPSGQLEPGKALVYVFHEERQDNGPISKGWVTTRVGLDGNWVGANHGNSYFFFSADPGDHHLCSNWQSSIKTYSRQGAALSFTAEPGKIYYFRVIVNEITQLQKNPSLDLKPLDPAEAQLLSASSAFSASKPKK